MLFQQIRNATFKIKYDELCILVDPWFAKKNSLRTIISPDLEKNKILNPTTELPISIQEIIKDVDICIITHTHIDHFDEESISYLAKDLKIFVQNQEDLNEVIKLGFSDVNILSELGSVVNNTTIYKTNGQHGLTAQTAEGPVCGFILENENEDTLYLCGDTIWYDEIRKTIDKYQPTVIILNACDARLKQSGRLIMNLSDIEEVRKYSVDSKIIVSHMEAVNHAYLSRLEVNKFIIKNNYTNIFVPKDGEEIKL